MGDQANTLPPYADFNKSPSSNRENGRIEIDGWSGGWIRVWKGGEALDPPPITEDMSAGSPDDNFIDAVLGRAESRTSPMNGIIQSELMDLIYESAETGVPARPER